MIFVRHEGNSNAIYFKWFQKTCFLKKHLKLYFAKALLDIFQNGLFELNWSN